MKHTFLETDKALNDFIKYLDVYAIPLDTLHPYKSDEQRLNDIINGGFLYVSNVNFPHTIPNYITLKFRLIDGYLRAAKLYEGQHVTIDNLVEEFTIKKRIKDISIYSHIIKLYSNEIKN
jgi:hypothetical protein